MSYNKDVSAAIGYRCRGYGVGAPVEMSEDGDGEWAVNFAQEGFTFHGDEYAFILRNGRWEVG